MYHVETLISLGTIISICTLSKKFFSLISCLMAFAFDVVMPSEGAFKSWPLGKKIQLEVSL